VRSYLDKLECSRCKLDYRSDQLHNLCSCGAPLFARYDLARVSKFVSPEDLGFRVHSLWRYWELLPLRGEENCVTLEEGFTPLIESRKLGPAIGLNGLHFKDESPNPTGSFKARGLSVAVSKAKELGVSEIALPSAGNAGSAAAAYAARAGMKCHVFVPEDTPDAFVSECRAYGADVRLVRGYITDAGRAMYADPDFKRWFDVSTCKEPYRVEGKKTILYELVQQLGWKFPDAIVFPTGGGTGIVAAWKACRELQELGWVKRSELPRLFAVQAAGCAPIVRALEQDQESAQPWQNPQTTAWGLRVPKAVADFLILRAIRESGGSALAVSEQEISDATAEMAKQEGLYVAPEAAAAFAALKHFQKMNLVRREDNVVLLLTGSALKYIS
jgi:threonine synthase